MLSTAWQKRGAPHAAQALPDILEALPNPSPRQQNPPCSVWEGLQMVAQWLGKVILLLLFIMGTEPIIIIYYGAQ